MTLQDLLREAAKLSRANRAELLDELIRLDELEGLGLELTPAQKEDLGRRIDEHKTGRAKLIPGDEAMARLRRREE
jgi:putative addiction module component (TIGR02574 family)